MNIYFMLKLCLQDDFYLLILWIKIHCISSLWTPNNTILYTQINSTGFPQHFLLQLYQSNHNTKTLVSNNFNSQSSKSIISLNKIIAATINEKDNIIYLLNDKYLLGIQINNPIELIWV